MSGAILTGHMRIITVLLALLSTTGPLLGQKQQNQPAPDSTTSFFSSVTVPKGSAQEDVVCILCSAEIQGRLTGDLVLIGGDASISGSVNGDVIVVGGWIVTSGPIGGEAFTLGGTVTRKPGAKIAGEVDSFPWLHLPGQRSFHPAAVLCLIAIVLLLVFLGGQIWKRGKSDRLGDLVVRRWWLALLVGGGLWYLYLEYLDEYETSSIPLEVLFWVLLLVLFVATWSGFYGLTWAIGRGVSQTEGWKTRLAGALMVSIALLIPVLGLVVLCMIFAIGLGAGLLFTWPATRGPKPVAIEP